MNRTSFKWSNNWLSVEIIDSPAVMDALAHGGMYESKHYKMYTPGWNSVVDGSRQYITGQRQFLFLGDGQNAVLAKLIL